jgi:hypothetical protein
MSITFSNSITGGSASGSVTVTLPGPVVPGDLLSIMLGSAGPATDLSPIVIDTVNAGPWQLPSTLHAYPGPALGGGAFLETVMGWIRCDTAGTSPAITISNLSTNTWLAIGGHYTGFINGNPTLVATDITINSGTSVTPAATPLTNSVPNELTVCFAYCTGAQIFGSVTGSFTGRVTANGDLWYGDAINAASSNTLNFGSTVTSAKWSVMLASFQDFVPPTSYFLESTEYF